MIEVKWEGADGRVWDLTRGPNVNLTQAGVAGLGMLAAETFVRTSATLDGQVVTGWKAKPRDIFLPIDVFSVRSELEWFSLQTALNRSFRPDRPGTLHVTDPLGNVRHIAARRVADGDQALEVDPTVDMALETGFTLVADDPWYLGPLVEHEFTDAAGARRGFYPGPGETGFYLAPATFTGAATVRNPGDVDAWPIWVLQGPVSEFRIEVGGRVIAGRFDIPSGATLRIDTRPQRKSAMLTSAAGLVTNVSPQLGQVQFARIPDGEAVPVSVVIAGTGRALVQLHPRYFMAWG